MYIRCAQKEDFDKVVSFYKYVIENTQDTDSQRYLAGKEKTFKGER